MLGQFWTHLDLLRYLGGSKWKPWGTLGYLGPLGVPRGLGRCSGHYPIPDSRTPLKKWFLGYPGWEATVGWWSIARVSDTLGSLRRVPACTGAHFRILLIFWSAEGKGFLKENRTFRKKKGN